MRLCYQLAEYSKKRDTIIFWSEVIGVVSGCRTSRSQYHIKSDLVPARRSEYIESKRR